MIDRCLKLIEDGHPDIAIQDAYCSGLRDARPTLLAEVPEHVWNAFCSRVMTRDALLNALNAYIAGPTPDPAAEPVLLDGVTRYATSSQENAPCKKCSQMTRRRSKYDGSVICTDCWIAENENATPAPAAETGKKFCDCECSGWACEDMPALFFGNGHNPKCDLFKPYDGAKKLIEELIAGVEWWASQEDGIPDEVWSAYERCHWIVRGRWPSESPAPAAEPMCVCGHSKSAHPYHYRCVSPGCDCDQFCFLNCSEQPAKSPAPAAEPTVETVPTHLLEAAAIAKRVRAQEVNDDVYRYRDICDAILLLCGDAAGKVGG